MMKTAKLFIDGEWYSNIILDFSCLESSIYTYLYNIFDLSEYNDGDSFEWHAENENGEIIISGIAIVNLRPSVILEVNDD